MYGSTCADMQVDVMGECLSISVAYITHVLTYWGSYGIKCVDLESFCTKGQPESGAYSPHDLGHTHRIRVDRDVRGDASLHEKRDRLTHPAQDTFLHSQIQAICLRNCFSTFLIDFQKCIY
ncbi:UNVERIFIED_CONTAM: hypothetical protein NCL1_13723 [Trichonephila clavipes]